MTLRGIIARGERGLGLGMGMELAAQETPRPVTQAAAAAPVPRTVAPSTSIDASSEFRGTLRCKQTLRIDGRIQGELSCERSVIVGECAKVQASITADEIQIAGTVEGDITARRKIVLERTAVVTGDLTTPGIVIEEGAKLKGRILIGSDAVPAESADADAKKVQALKKAGAKPAEAAAAPQPIATSA